MRDPLSAARTTIGAVSCGIEVCKGLVWYFDNARGGDERISQIKDQMDRLAVILELLETVVSKLGPSPSVEETRDASVACSQALEKIREKLDSLSTPATGSGSKIGQRLRKVKQRISFPFKQDGLWFAETWWRACS
jgi:hypothetical protein